VPLTAADAPEIAALVDDALRAWTDAAQAVSDSAYMTPPYTDRHLITPEYGRRYIRVWSVPERNPEDRSAYAFIDRTTGDVLKADGWKRPASNFPRGNILGRGDTSFGTRCLGPYSAS
jgi:hypothetical protein